jgi:uncharacterized protein
MSRTFKLYRLQQIDSQMDKINKRLKEIQSILENDHALNQARESVYEAEQLKETAQKNLNKTEDSVKQQHLKIEQSESTLYSGKVHNPKELQDIQNEVASLKRYLDVLEERQLEAMLEDEEAAMQLKTAQEKLGTVQSEFEEKSKELITEREKLNADMIHFQREHQATANNIPPEDIEQYMKLRQTRRGIAVSKVVEKTCSSCGSTINASLLHAARSPSEITTCDVCGRILYTG